MNKQIPGPISRITVEEGIVHIDRIMSAAWILMDTSVGVMAYNAVGNGDGRVVDQKESVGGIIQRIMINIRGHPESAPPFKGDICQAMLRDDVVHEYAEPPRTVHVKKNTVGYRRVGNDIRCQIAIKILQIESSPPGC